jgi:hypothetical protein
MFQGAMDAQRETTPAARVARAQSMKRSITSRRGVTAVLAMMYLGLFSVLALGFFASVSTSGQMAKNETSSVGARMAAESGMQFMKYHLAAMDIPKSTPESQLLNACYTALSASIDGTQNMPNTPASVRDVVGMNLAGTKILIPYMETSFIKSSADGYEFRATVERQGKYGLRVTVIGRDNRGNVVTNNVQGGRGVQLEYQNELEAGTMFDYGVASKSTVSLAGTDLVGPVGNDDLASILVTNSAATPMTMNAQARLTGDITITGGTPSLHANAEVDGLTQSNVGFWDNVHTIAEPPDFPAIDTTDFLAYVPAKGSVGPSVITTPIPIGLTFRNIRIRAGANPVFAAGTVLEGVVVIEHPNQVQFAGQCTIKGVIVSECGAADNNNQALVDADIAANGVMDSWVQFNGTMSAVGVENLDPAVFPESLRAMTGSLILIPGFKGNFLGTMDNIGGAIVASGMTWGGSAGGTLNGTIMNVAPNVPLTMTGNNVLTITGHGLSNPAGMRFISHFSPKSSTYREIRP